MRCFETKRIKNLSLFDRIISVIGEEGIMIFRTGVSRTLVSLILDVEDRRKRWVTPVHSRRVIPHSFP